MIVTRPPSGIASRALMTRFMTICSSCPGSASTAVPDRVQLENQLDLLSEQRAEHGRQVLHDLAHVQDTWLHDLLVAEGQQLPCQGGGEGRGCLDLIDVLAQVGLVGPDLASREIAVAGDRLQDVVEVVRDPAGETPDGFHLLGLAQLVLALLERLVCLLTLGQCLLERTGLPRDVA